MQIAIDAGNSGIKVGLFENGQLIKQGKLISGQSILDVLTTEELNKTNTIVSCSVLNNLDVKDLPKVKYLKIDINSRFPFPINYESPETLGIDRAVACAGVFTNKSNLLVIDAGSCITYDFVDQQKGYIGGAISPGIEMRFKAMNNFTDKLPLISEFENKPEMIGNTTSSCLKSGVINGIKQEIEGFITHFDSISSNLNVFLTGGNANFLGAELKSGIFADQNLVLKGLNSLIDLNDA